MHDVSCIEVDAQSFFFEDVAEAYRGRQHDLERKFGPVVRDVRVLVCARDYILATITC
jgi:hypothetical protein